MNILGYKIINIDKLVNNLCIKRSEWLKGYGEHLNPNNLELRNNISNNVEHLLDVLLEIDKIEISETTDTKTKVIMLISKNGKKSSFWLNNEKKINSLTNY